MEHRNDDVVGQADALEVPRFAGLTTFARLPRLEDLERCDVAVVGVPFDSGTTYRPGARFGPSHIRQASRLLRPYNPAQQNHPFGAQQVVDAGDVACNPFRIGDAIEEIGARAGQLLDHKARLMALGGDHTIALPLLRAIKARHGPVALVHFDAHLDTWDTYFGEQYTHGTPFRRASEEGLFLPGRSMHIGIRGPLYSDADLVEDAAMGFAVVSCTDVERQGVAGVVERVRERVGETPLYVSVDIDVLDPAHAPATGTPEPGGLTSRELLGVLRGLAGLKLVSADIVEVSPPYDHAELTGLAAAHVAYELIGLMAPRARPDDD